MTDNGLEVVCDERMVVLKPPIEMSAEIAECVLGHIWNHYNESAQGPIIFDISAVYMSDRFLRVIREVQQAEADPAVVFGVVYGTVSLAVRLFEETNYANMIPGERSVRRFMNASYLPVACH